VPEEDTPSIADALEEQDTQAPDSTGQAAQTEESPSYFEDKFDPATLPDEIREQYNEMRGDYTRKTQSLAEQRQEAEAMRSVLEDPESHAAFIRSLPDEYQMAILKNAGYDVEDDGSSEMEMPEYEDPYEPRLSALENHLQERQQQEQLQAQQEAETDYVANELEALSQQTGREFDDEEIEAVLALAVLNRDPETGAPDIKGAYEHLYSRVFATERKRYAQGKRPPHVQANGSSATEEIDTDSPDKRVEALLQIAQANEE
jgi:hypothetical protein